MPTPRSYGTAFLTALSLGVVGGAAAVIGLVELQVGLGPAALERPRAAFAEPEQDSRPGPHAPSALKAAALPARSEVEKAGLDEAGGSMRSQHPTSSAGEPVPAAPTADPGLRQGVARPSAPQHKGTASEAAGRRTTKAFEFQTLNRSAP